MLGAGSLLLFNVVCIYLCVVFHFRVVCHATWLGSVVREFYHSSLVWQLIYHLEPFPGLPTKDCCHCGYVGMLC